MNPTVAAAWIRNTRQRAGDPLTDVVRASTPPEKDRPAARGCEEVKKTVSTFYNDLGALVKSESKKRTLLFHRRVPTFMEAKELELRRTARGMSRQAWDTVLRDYGISPGGYRKVLKRVEKTQRRQQ